MEVVVGLFENQGEAEQAVDGLLKAGFARDEISLVFRDNQAQGDPTTSPAAKSNQEKRETAMGAAVGASGGAAAGGFAGLLLSVGLVVVPGIGPIVAAGTVASTLTAMAVGAGVGAAAGGLAGALMGFGVPEEEASMYAQGIESGNVLVLVHAGAARAEAAAHLLRQGAREVGTHLTDLEAG